MTTWDYLLKQMLWQQLDFAKGMKILDFGSGCGETAAHMAQWNVVTAVEPSQEMLAQRVDGAYRQLQGSMDVLRDIPDESFDMVLCHNVLEYVDDKSAYLRELARLVKPGGLLSLCKHNRAGRVMQMTVLLNNFGMANHLLDGRSGVSSQFGDIRYYQDEDVLQALPHMTLEKLWGARTFWDLQQNQECHADPAWQAQMLAMEHRVSTMPDYQAIAFFHHLLLRKQG